MIDVETDIYSVLCTSLREAFPNIFISSEYVKAPSSFPAVSIVEADNYIVERTQDSSENENHAGLMYEINVYSNQTTNKKSECKTIFQAVDTAMSQLGFTRISLAPVPNLADATIYRMTGRYRAVVSKTHKIYRR